MAAYAHYRHVELDKVGCGKKRALQPPGGECHDVFGSNDCPPISQVPHHRITKPPGGESSDIFGSSPTNTPPTTPRKVKNYMASTIFTPETDPQQIKSRQRPDADSFNRLFGANGDAIDGQLTPRGKNHQKSNILFTEAAKSNGQANGHANGHLTNIVTVTNGTNGHETNGHTNGTNGFNGIINGTNGHAFDHGNGSTGSISGSSSGSATPNGSINGDHKSNGHFESNGGSNGIHGTPTRRIPPGGYSSKLW